jgi:polysaccharide pyruvyl transferase WcaK-like protein
MSQQSLVTHGPPTLLPMQTTTGRPGALRLLHVGVHNSANRNAGDTLLFPVVRRLFDAAFGDNDWTLRQAWSPFLNLDAADANGRYDGLVIGGGGLLLRDQAGSDVGNSGWQWNSSVEAVQALRLPVAVFAIGYNRFRGQDDFDPVFTDHIRALADASGFFGLRNHGSIRALGRYLQPAQAERLAHQYCPTTVIWQLYEQHRAAALEHDASGQRVLAFNAAFDRAHLRFGENADDVLGHVARAVKRAQERGWRIVVAAHKTMDREIEPHLDKAGVDYDTVDLTDAGPGEVMAFYARVDLAMGMRGHAQMIPFGLRRAVISLISHDKMRYFLDDIGHPEWGFEVADGQLIDRIDAQLQRLETDAAGQRALLDAAQERVWRATRANMARIGTLLNTPSRLGD